MPERLLLMVSGGADSTYLFHAALARVPAAQLHVLHVNHHLRPGESDRDQNFVEGLCARFDVGCTVKDFDVAALAERGHANVEELARRLRYQAALELTHPGDHILTAHTLNDRIETFLMRLMRGAGIDNLDGLRSERELHGRHLTRPLLGLNHASIVESLKQRGLAWVEDSTNQDEHYDRAFLRHRVILLLEQRNPDFLYTCARTLDNLDDDLGCLDAYGSILFAKSFDKERIELDLSYLEGESAQEWPLLPAVGQRVIYKACQAALVRWAPQARLTKLHVQGLWQNRQENGFSCHLPGGVEARIKAGVLTFKKAKAPRVYPTRREDSQNVTQEGRNR